MYDDYGYLIHSAKGTSWSKKNAKYKKKVKVNGVWKYIYTDKFDEATKHENGDKSGYVLDENGNRIHNSVTFDARRGEWTDPTVGATRIKNSIESINNSAKKINESTGKVSRKISKSREESARINGGKNLSETKERRAFEKEAARREKVTRSNREQQARVNARSKEMADYSEGRRLKETLSSRGYKKEIQGNPSNEYLRELESNTRKNRW